jgi:hypothetical protein
VQVTPTSGPGDATALRARPWLRAATCWLFVVATAPNEVVGGVAGSDVPLLVIPGGIQCLGSRT